MRNRVRGLAAVALLAAALAPASALAATPGAVTQQGRLFDGAGAPLSGTVTLQFAVYAAATGGAPLWTETDTVALDAGYFSVEIGQGQPFPAGLWDGSTRYVGITVGSDAEMSPRQQVVSVPYALVAGDVTGDIHPHSVTVNGTAVINAAGNWVGPSTGLIGPAGAAGAQGATGPQGPQGVAGSNGAVGATGPQGVAGSNGANGTNGTNGAVGATGPQGAAGTNGTNGAVGPTGAAGTNGTNGAVGPTGTAGTNGTNGAVGPTGAAGTNGTNGAVGAVGATGPTGALGPQGAVGPTGAAGTNGTNGAVGATGPQGAAGTNGTNGAVGATGPQGAAGTNGANGAAGATGPQGAAGTNGTNGTNGANGAAGPTGPQGATGSTGAVGATGPNAVTATTTFGTGVIPQTALAGGSNYVRTDTTTSSLTFPAANGLQFNQPNMLVTGMIGLPAGRTAGMASSDYGQLGSMFDTGTETTTLFLAIADNVNDSVYIGGGGLCCGAAAWRGLRVYGSGDANLSGSITTNMGSVGFGDVAENIPTASGFVAGDVVSISDTASGKYDASVFVLSARAYDSAVAGVISEKPSVTVGNMPKAAPLALSGVVHVKVTNEGGFIKPGDLLTTSSTRGHAMKAKNPPPGTVVGKAVEALGAEAKTGSILMLVLPR
jgi:hypothetical protein